MQIQIDGSITLIGLNFNLYQDRWTEVKNGADVGLTFAVERGTISSVVKEQYKRITAKHETNIEWWEKIEKQLGFDLEDGEL